MYCFKLTYRICSRYFRIDLAFSMSLLQIACHWRICTDLHSGELCRTLMLRRSKSKMCIMRPLLIQKLCSHPRQRSKLSTHDLMEHSRPGQACYTILYRGVKVPAHGVKRNVFESELEKGSYGSISDLVFVYVFLWVWIVTPSWTEVLEIHLKGWKLWKVSSVIPLCKSEEPGLSGGSSL